MPNRGPPRCPLLQSSLLSSDTRLSTFRKQFQPLRMAADFAAPKCRNLPLLTLAVARMDLYNRLEFVDPIALWLTANHAQHDLVFQITPKPASAVPFAPLCGPRVGTVRGLWSQWKLCTFVGARGRRRANGGLRRPERRRGWTQCHPSFGCQGPVGQKIRLKTTTAPAARRAALILGRRMELQLHAT